MRRSNSLSARSTLATLEMTLKIRISIIITDKQKNLRLEMVAIHSRFNLYGPDGDVGDSEASTLERMLLHRM